VCFARAWWAYSRCYTWLTPRGAAGNVHVPDAALHAYELRARWWERVVGAEVGRLSVMGSLRFGCPSHHSLPACGNTGRCGRERERASVGRNPATLQAAQSPGTSKKESCALQWCMRGEQGVPFGGVQPSPGWKDTARQSAQHPLGHTPAELSRSAAEDGLQSDSVGRGYYCCRPRVSPRPLSSSSPWWARRHGLWRECAARARRRPQGARRSATNRAGSSHRYDTSPRRVST
jgi:hypothetical protein